jgi:hypothetical protein
LILNLSVFQVNSSGQRALIPTLLISLDRSSSNPQDSTLEKLVNASHDVIAALMPTIQACSGMNYLEEAIPSCIEAIRHATDQVSMLVAEYRSGQSGLAGLRSSIQGEQTALDSVRQDLENVIIELETS